MRTIDPGVAGRSGLVAGVDGCRGGWVVVTADLEGSDAARVEVCATFAEVAALGHRMVAVDMPIGLPRARPRACDLAARRVVGPRRSSVFPAPVRAVLDAVDYPDALHRSRAASGKGLSKQAWFLVPKIREVDAVVRAAGQHRVREAHPESAFVALAGGFLPPKRHPEGAALRRRLVELALQELADALTAPPPRGAAPDDVLDAAVLVWTARRLVRGDATVLGDGETDDVGLRMEIVY